jgi:hypothetical protein
MNQSQLIVGEPAAGRPKWLNEPVQTAFGSPIEISQKIPLFERRPFVAPSKNLQLAAENGQTGNRFYDLIVRVSSDRCNEVPVGVVSKTYGLIQHQDLFHALTTALGKAGVRLGKLRSELTLSEYMGRMRLGFILPEEYGFDPGDGHPMALRLECFNSVDGSSRLWVMLGWLRFVCGNGLVLGTTRLNVRRIHNGRIDIGVLGESLQEALTAIRREQETIKAWMRKEVSPARLESFADRSLKRKWGAHAAARFLLICETGRDGVPKDPFQNTKPSQLKMREGRSVPGSVAPARNAYAASQALAWLVQQRNDIQERIERARHIPGLIAALLRHKN